MSLIKCPECGQDVSDKAKVCPHCGYELIKEEKNLALNLDFGVQNDASPFDVFDPPKRRFSELEKEEKRELQAEFEKSHPKYPLKSTNTKSVVFVCIAFLILIPVIMIVAGVIIKHERQEHYFDDKPYAFVGLEGFTKEELSLLCELHGAKRISYKYQGGNTYLLYDDEIDEYNNVGWPFLQTSIAILVIYAPFSIGFWIAANRLEKKVIIYDKIFQAWLARDKHIDYQLEYVTKKDKKKANAVDLTKYPF